MDDVNSNDLTSNHSRNWDSSDEASFKMGKRDSQKRKMDHNRHHEKTQDNQDVFQSDILPQKDKRASSAAKKKKRDQSDRKSGDGDTLLGNKNSKDDRQKSKFDSREKCKSASESGRFGSEGESNTKSKPSKESREGKEDDRMSGMLRSPDAQKRRETKHAASRDSERECSKHKKAKMKEDGNEEEPSMSFESYLNYDVNVYKRKERSGGKKPPKKLKAVIKEPQMKDPGMKTIELAPKQVHLSVAFAFTLQAISLVISIFRSSWSL